MLILLLSLLMCTRTLEVIYAITLVETIGAPVVGTLATGFILLELYARLPQGTPDVHSDNN